MRIKKYLSFIVCLLLGGIMASSAFAQDDINQLPSRGNVNYDSQGRPIRKNNNNDSLIHRNPLEDSLTIYYRYFDSTRIRFLDSSINDFYKRFPLPYYYNDLGNFGTPAHSLFFDPYMKPGWDAGFHAFDIYRYKLEDTRFFSTTRPYTELNYLIGNKAEQMANILHTQNRKSNLNFVFEYRFITSPGALRNQNTNHSNMRINADYQSKNKRYSLNAIYISNKLRSAENGGIRKDSKLDSLSLGDPFEADVRMGNNATSYRNFFSTNIPAGEDYKDVTFFFRHSYDFGQKDSLVTDSTTYKLFYPRLRLQHTLRYSSYRYNFHDNNADSLDYETYFNYKLPRNISGPTDTLLFQDQWKEINNEFSIITYPQKNNLSQFLKLSAAYQHLKGTFDSTDNKVFNNIYASAEYRNRTKNQKWDVEATGQLYLTGDYAGDYSAYVSLKRVLSKRLGSLEIGLHDVNRTPSFINEPLSAFPSIPVASYKKENIARLFATIDLPQQLKLTGNYYAVTNYVYFDSFLTSKQEATLFNVLRVGLEKKIRLSRLFNWYTEIYLQKATGNAPVNLPLFFTRNRIALEGNFFTNLFLSTGLEVRYYSPFKPDNYSPLTGQFFVQDGFTTNNRPDINYYLNFRIKSFKAFGRIENLNTLNYSSNKGVGFTKHNFLAPHYPAPTMWIRVGIWWSFVN